jgi:mRNA interferase HigB
VNVISRRKIREFYNAKPARQQHAAAFEEWFKAARNAEWHNFQDTKGLFGQTDVASNTKSGKTATIFDVGGNKYRIIAIVNYNRQTVYITHVLDHKDYSKNKWKNEI